MMVKTPFHLNPINNFAKMNYQTFVEWSELANSMSYLVIIGVDSLYQQEFDPSLVE